MIIEFSVSFLVVSAESPQLIRCVIDIDEVRSLQSLLKKVQVTNTTTNSCSTKPDKRPADTRPDSKIGTEGNKRSKSGDNLDKDFRVLPVSDVTKTTEPKASAPATNRDSDEIDRNSAAEFMGPDFSLEFPDDLEDYDEAEAQTYSNM